MRVTDLWLISRLDERWERLMAVRKLILDELGAIQGAAGLEEESEENEVTYPSFFPLKFSLTMFFSLFLMSICKNTPFFLS